MEKLETYLKKIDDENWRNICNTVIFIRCPQKLEILKKAGFEVDSRNDGFIALCFIDHTEGLSFYVIAAAHIREQNIFISKENKSSKVIFTIQTLCDCLYLPQDCISMNFSRWDFYVNGIINECEKDFEESTEIRDIMELDDFRNPQFPDEIEILLIGKAFGQERVHVLAEKYGENCLFGVLLDEPVNAAGCHKGDMIDFMLVEREDRFCTVHVCK